MKAATWTDLEQPARSPGEPLHCTALLRLRMVLPRRDLIEWLKGEQLWNQLTPRELTFFKHDRNPKEEVIWMAWCSASIRSCCLNSKCYRPTAPLSVGFRH